MRPFAQALLLSAVSLTVQHAAAISNADADGMFDAFNNVFLSGSQYVASLDNTGPDQTWAASLDIMGAEDAYDRTGAADRKTLVNNLLTTWLQNNEPPWSWDGWNDDIGWFTMALVRGYQITGTQDFLTQAEYGFNYAYGRGWDTQYNGGGIWEQMPADDNGSPTKEALSNDSLGKVAALLYQSTGNQTYLETSEKIYAWVRQTIFDPSTGQVYTGVNKTGFVNESPAAYNQGTFLDYANLLWKITWNDQYKGDAMMALEYGKSSLTNSDGIFSNSASWLNTWADEMARGVGNFVSDAGLWDEYYPWIVQNAEAILTNRRADKNITWNAWAEPTPEDENSLITNKFVSAVAWLQYTPAVKPTNVSGISYITNKATGLRADSGGSFSSGKNILQWGANPSLNQKWQIRQSPDFSWTITNLGNWLVMDCPDGQTTDGLNMVNWPSNRQDNQRWWIDQQSDDGTYKIWNKESGKALDGGSLTNNGASLGQNDWSGADSQRWIISHA